MPFYSDQARVNPNDPRRAAACERCGRIHNLESLTPQYRWAGMQLINTNVYVCPRCLDVSVPFERAIILQADPPPTFLARPIRFDDAEDDFITAEDGTPLIDETTGAGIVPEGS
jgi:hypothetical protein